MRWYAAPMEGVTDHIWREAHHRYFPGADRYYMPFFSPTADHVLTPRVRRELDPENNAGVPAVPQALTRSAPDFLWAAGELAAMGYPEISLNLGCPSGTVTAKGKGAGMLADPEALDRFLGAVFERAPLPVSVKTRLGVADEGEFGRLLEIFNRYPIAELTVHARVLRDQYGGRARREAFARALPGSRAPVCYNGDLFSAGDCRALEAEFPALPAAMLGRGLIADPALLRKAQGGPGADRETLRAYLGELGEAYARAFGGASAAMARMKGLWSFQFRLFEDDGTYEKRLRRARTPEELASAAAAVLRDLPLRRDAARP